MLEESPVFTVEDSSVYLVQSQMCFLKKMAMQDD